ncbi:hypothetical protein ACHAXT_005230 [Thalassiosira profunda]
MAYAGVFCWRSASGYDFVYGDNYDYGSEHELVQRVALAITIMGATAWGLYFLALCVRFPPCLWLLISLTLVATFICEGIMFTFFGSDRCQVQVLISNCGLGTSSRCGIAACIFWAISSFMTCGMFKEAQDREKGTESAEEPNDSDD